MADIALVATKIAPVMPQHAEIFPKIAAEALTAGQAVYQTATGTVGVADATTAGALFPFFGIALQSAGIGQAVDVLVRGIVSGFTVAAVNCGTVVFLSETAGALADATPAGTGTPNKVGVVTALSDAVKTRVVFITGPVL